MQIKWRALYQVVAIILLVFRFHIYPINCEYIFIDKKMLKLYKQNSFQNIPCSRRHDESRESLGFDQTMPHLACHRK
jgi:hypothetical protein